MSREACSQTHCVVSRSFLAHDLIAYVVLSTLRMEYGVNLIPCAYNHNDSTHTFHLKALVFQDGSLAFELRRLVVRLFPSRSNLRFCDLLQREYHSGF